MKKKLLILTAAVILRSAPAQYNAVPIATPAGWTGITITGLNNLGQVVGFGTNGSTRQAFIATTSAATPIPQPAGFVLKLTTGINNSGLVAGSGFVANTNQAFIGTVAGITLLPLTNFLFISAPNNSGQVAGDCVPSGLIFPEPCIVTASGTTGIPFPNGFFIVDGLSACCYINDAGQVAAAATNPNGVEAFIGTPAGSVVMPTPPAWNLSTFGLNGLNGAGHILNFGSNIVADAGQAFLGTISGSTPIPLPNGAPFAHNAAGYGTLNDSDVALGNSDAGFWIWDRVNQTRLLNNLIPAGWSVVSAYSINNAGQILAYAASPGGVSEYVLLTPGTTVMPTTPAPATLGLTVAGVALAALLAFKRSAHST